MHKSSMLRMQYFVKHYVATRECEGRRCVLDVGSCDVNGSYKILFSELDIEYVGLDITSGSNVDVIVDNHYKWDVLKNNSFDYIISGQAFEHIESPWLTMNEIYKKLKDDGIVCIIAPNGLFEHRFPLDCYRYYADGLRAMATQAGLEIIEVSVGGVPDINVSTEWDDIWNDVCLVACKSSSVANSYKKMFPIERRYKPFDDLMLRYEFVSKYAVNTDEIKSLS